MKEFVVIEKKKKTSENPSRFTNFKTIKFSIMKKFLLPFGLLLATIFSLSAQYKSLSIEERAEKADFIFEGKVIEQRSFWDN